MGLAFSNITDGTHRVTFLVPWMKLYFSFTVLTQSKVKHTFATTMTKMHIFVLPDRTAYFV